MDLTQALKLLKKKGEDYNIQPTSPNTGYKAVRSFSALESSLETLANMAAVKYLGKEYDDSNTVIGKLRREEAIYETQHYDPTSYSTPELLSDIFLLGKIERPAATLSKTLESVAHKIVRNTSNKYIEKGLSKSVGFVSKTTLMDLPYALATPGIVTPTKTGTTIEPKTLVDTLIANSAMTTAMSLSGSLSRLGKKNTGKEQTKENLIIPMDKDILFDEPQAYSDVGIAYKKPQNDPEFIQQSIPEQDIDLEQLIKDELIYQYGMKEKNIDFNVKIVDELPSKVKYDGKNLLIDKSMLANEESITQMLDMADTELTKAFAKPDSILPEINDIIKKIDRGEEPDIEPLLNKIKNKQGGSKIIDDVYSLIDKYKSGDIDKTELLNFAKRIDDAAEFKEVKTEPPQSVRAMNKQQRIKHQLFESLNKNIKQESVSKKKQVEDFQQAMQKQFEESADVHQGGRNIAEDITPEEQLRNLQSIGYDNLKVEKDYVNKAYEQIRKGFETSKEIDDYVKAYVLSEIYPKDVRKQMVLKKIDEYKKAGKKVDVEKAKKEVNEFIANKIKDIRKKVVGLLDRAHFKDELEHNIASYTTPKLEGKRIVLDGVDVNKVFDFLVRDRLKGKLKDENFLKRMERVESAKAKELKKKKETVTKEQVDRAKTVLNEINKELEKTEEQLKREDISDTYKKILIGKKNRLLEEKKEAEKEFGIKENLYKKQPKEKVKKTNTDKIKQLESTQKPTKKKSEKPKILNILKLKIDKEIISIQKAIKQGGSKKEIKLLKEKLAKAVNERKKIIDEIEKLNKNKLETTKEDKKQKAEPPSTEKQIEELDISHKMSTKSGLNTMRGSIFGNPFVTKKEYANNKTTFYVGDNKAATLAYYNWLKTGKIPDIVAKDLSVYQKQYIKGILKSLENRRRKIIANLDKILKADKLYYKGTGVNDKYNHVKALWLYANEMKKTKEKTTTVNIKAIKDVYKKTFKKEQQSKETKKTEPPTQEKKIKQTTDKTKAEKSPEKKIEKEPPKEPPNQEKKTKQKENKKHTEKIDLRFRETVDNEFENFGKVDNNVKINEYMKAEDIEADGHYGTTYDNEIYAAGGSNAMQAYTVIHELAHNVFPKMSEKEIIKLSKNVILYMASKSKALKERWTINRDITEPPLTNEMREVIKWINGNEKAKEVLFGKQSLFDKYVSFEERVSQKIGNTLSKTLKSLGLKITSQDIEILGVKLPRIIKKILMEMDFFNPKEKNIEKALHYKKEAKDLLNRIILNIKKQIENIGLSKEQLMFVVESDYERMLPYKYFIEIFNDKKMKQLYKSFVAKFGKEKVDNFLKHNDESFKQTRYYLSTVDEYEKFFGGSKYVIPALQLRAWYMMKKRKINISEKDLEKLRTVYSEVKDMSKKAGLDEKSFMIGYYPHIYDTPYDIRIAFTSADEAILREDGYKHYKDNVWYKMQAEQDVSSSIFFFEKTKRAGFIKNITSSSELKEIRQRFGDNIKIVKQGKKLIAIAQPKAVKELIKMSDNPAELIAGTYKKSYEAFFNHTTIKETSKDIIGNIISTESKKGFKSTSPEETAFLNKVLNANEEHYYIDENYYHYIFNKEILPENEKLAIAYKAWKSVVQRLKGNLTFKSVSAFLNNNIAGFINLAYIGVNPKYIPDLVRTTATEYKEFKKFIERYHKIVAEKGFNEGQKFLKVNKKNNIFIEVLLESKLGSLIESPEILFGKDNTYLDKIMHQWLRKMDNKYGTTIGNNIFSLYKTLSLDRSTVIGKYLFNFYGMSDLFYRVIAYKYLKNRFGKEEAIRQINDIFVDYSKPVDPTIHATEFTGFPFLTWYLRMQGGLLRIAKKRPVTFSAMIAMYIAMQYILDEDYEPKDDEYVKGIRVESWFTHKVLFDPMTFQASIANQLINGKIDKVLELSAMPKTYEEAIAVAQGNRNPAELLGFNMEPKWLVAKHKKLFRQEQSK